MMESDTLQWHHNEHNGVPNHRCLDCSLNRLFRHRSKITSKIRVTVVCEGNLPVTGGSPHKGSVTRIMSSFDDIIIHANKGRTSGLSHRAEDKICSKMELPHPAYRFWLIFRRNRKAAKSLETYLYHQTCSLPKMSFLCLPTLITLTCVKFPRQVLTSLFKCGGNFILP